MRKTIVATLLAAALLGVGAHTADAATDPGTPTGKCVWARIYVGPFGGYQWYCFPR